MTTFAIVLESLHIPIASDGVLLQAATFAACRTLCLRSGRYCWGLRRAWLQTGVPSACWARILQLSSKHPIS